MHCPGSILPPVCPYDRSNGSNIKTHWALEELLAAVVSTTTNISYRSPLMANGLMEEGSCYCWVHLQLSQKLLAAAPLTANNHSSLTLSTSILPLVTASWWEASGTPSFLLTKPLVTTGYSASMIFLVP